MDRKRAPTPGGNRLIRKHAPPAPVFPWGGAFEAYARGFVARNFWRVRHLLLSEEDARQECAIVFLRCQRAYRGDADNPRHMMALYKTALAREWHTLSTKDSQRRSALEEARSYDLPDQIDHCAGFLAAALASHGEEMRDLLSLLANAPSEVLGLIFLDDDLAGINRRLKRFLGIKDRSRDLMSELRDALMP